MKVYQIVPIIGYGGWGDLIYGEPIKTFSKHERAKEFLDEYKLRSGKVDWTIKEIEVEE